MLCLIHRVLTPVLLVLSPALATLLPGSATLHRVLIFLVVLLGRFAFVSGYKKHRRGRILLPTCVGVALVAYGAFGDAYLCSEVAETCVTVAGSMCLIIAMA